MVDMGKMRKGYQDQQRAGEFYNFEKGDTLLYIHPQCRQDDKYEPTDGVNYVPVVVHYDVGKKKAMVVSHDVEINPIVEHPFVKRILKKKKVKLAKECPVKREIEDGGLDDDEADRSRAQTKYLWGATPISHRSDASEPWRKLEPKAAALLTGKTVYDGIMEVFFDNGDITDPKAAILVKVNRQGTKLKTKYKVAGDPDTLKKPMKLGKALRAILKKTMKEGGDLDLFKIVANMIKGEADIEAILAGVKTSEEPDDDFDDDDDDSDDDDEPDEDEGEDSDDDDDDDDEPDEDEGEDSDDDDDEPDEDEGEDSDDDDDEPDEDEGDSDSDDSDDDDDDDEPEETPKEKKAREKAEAKAKKASKAKCTACEGSGKSSKGKTCSPCKGTGKKSKSAGGDDDDLGLDEIDAELKRIADDEKSKGKGKGKGAKGKGKK